MAFITRFEKQEPNRKNIHKTNVVCKYFTLERDGVHVVQLNTYGSSDREMPDKLSQTIQIGRKEAAELIAILKDEFKLI
jgi:hypothetical protein